MEPTNPQTSEHKIALYDENAKFIRWITPEEEARMNEDYDEEFMCPKLMASYLRKFQRRHEQKQNA